MFLGFGFLKYFPGISPAQAITEASTHILFLGLIPGSVAIKMIATLECVIGICLLVNRGMRLAIWLLGIEFIGILSPIFLFPARLFSGPHHAPTLLAQYCLKDIILVAGGLVVAAASFRGGRMIRRDLPPSVHVRRGVVDADHKLRIVLDGINRPEELNRLLERNQITESEFYSWRETALSGASHALLEPSETSGSDDDARLPLSPNDGTPVAETLPVGSRFHRSVLTILAIAFLRR